LLLVLPEDQTVANGGLIGGEAMADLESHFQPTGRVGLNQPAKSGISLLVLIENDIKYDC
jgi:hypothetical protein